MDINFIFTPGCWLLPDACGHGRG